LVIMVGRVAEGKGKMHGSRPEAGRGASDAWFENPPYERRLGWLPSKRSTQENQDRVGFASTSLRACPFGSAQGKL
jgi:hypothetical protein